MQMILQTLSFLLLLASLLLLDIPKTVAAPPSCNAAAEGTIVYNKDHKAMQFCDGAIWINMGANLGADTLASLSCASGQIAKWNGTVWACAADGGSLPALSSANIWVGDGSSVATAVAMSGDATISNAGVLTIGSNAIGSAEITNASIALADLSATGTASGTTYLRGDNTWATIPSSIWLNNGPGGPGEIYYNTGYVGVGTNDPGAQLEVGGQGQVDINHGVASIVDFIDGNPADYDGRIRYEHATREMQFFTQQSQRMVIDNAGNVGIGTTDPLDKLSVVGNISASNSAASSIVSTNTSLSGGVAQFYLGNTGAGGANWTINAGNTATGTLGGRLGVAEGSNYRLVIEQGGNVGIGTVDPTTALDVSGTVTATAFAGSGASLTSLNATNIGSGTVPTARLGSGTANTTTFLRGDNTWATPSGGGAASDYQVFTASGTWTKPATGNTVLIECWGGGGGGGGNSTCCGGGGGGYISKVVLASSLSATVAVTIGAGGSAGASGGTSSFGSYASATGGAGPSGWYGGTGGGFGGGGSATACYDGNPNAGGGVWGGGGGGACDGTSGGWSLYGGGGGGGGGGSGIGGQSGRGGNGGNAGVAGTAPGGGGGAGAAGARGECRIVTW